MNQIPASASGSEQAPLEQSLRLPEVDPQPFVREDVDGLERLDLLVENMNCAGCLKKVERNMAAEPGVVSARVNMSTRRLALKWRAGEGDPARMVMRLGDLGYPATPFNPETLTNAGDGEEKHLLACMAVAGFATANVMLLSVAIWSGHGGEMGDGTRTLLHWISALIAIPAVGFAGRAFFKSAFNAIKHRQLNMDVPITLAGILATVMSVHQTWLAGPHAYFDAAVSLLFFLLIGRYLDRQARAKARAGAERLLSL